MAIAHRVTPDSEPKLTRETAFQPRWSKLTRRLTEYRGYWLPTSFDGHGAIDEYWACREGAAIMDLSPLRKWEILGPDAEELLQATMTRDIRRLSDGQVVYTAVCNDTGGMIDDGTVFRIAATNFRFVGGSEWDGVWLRDQAERLGLSVWIKESTDELHNVAVQGPNSRELLAPLVEGVDLGNEAFGYMNVRTGRIAGVDDCVLWRIGFTGELSYELHVPAGYGLHVWEQLIQAGARPFGVEAQRILRLEKGHFIVGQDTDGLTQGFSAGLDWAIKLDKPDFVGKTELSWQADRGNFPRLVGLRPLDRSVVPEEASQILSDGGHIVGRITSSRMSPSLGHAVCLGQLDAHLAEPGNRVTVRLRDGRDIRAEVTAEHAQFDPEGKRQRV
jgi:sarcosine oxidase subunit alpha